jgi:hypothetical protein
MAVLNDLPPAILPLLIANSTQRRGKGGRQPAEDPRLDPKIDPKRATRILSDIRHQLDCLATPPAEAPASQHAPPAPQTGSASKHQPRRLHGSVTPAGRARLVRQAPSSDDDATGSSSSSSGGGGGGKRRVIRYRPSVLPDLDSAMPLPQLLQQPGSPEPAANSLQTPRPQQQQQQQQQRGAQAFTPTTPSLRAGLVKVPGLLAHISPSPAPPPTEQAAALAAAPAAVPRELRSFPLHMEELLMMQEELSSDEGSASDTEAPTADAHALAAAEARPGSALAAEPWASPRDAIGRRDQLAPSIGAEAQPKQLPEAPQKRSAARHQGPAVERQEEEAEAGQELPGSYGASPLASPAQVDALQQQNLALVAQLGELEALQLEHRGLVQRVQREVEMLQHVTAHITQLRAEHQQLQEEANEMVELQQHNLLLSQQLGGLEAARLEREQLEEQLAELQQLRAVSRQYQQQLAGLPGVQQEVQ